MIASQEINLPQVVAEAGPHPCQMAQVEWTCRTFSWNALHL